MSKATGAMPGESATRTQRSYPFGPGWAAYRLPVPGLGELVDARAAGICFEGEGDAGAAGSDSSKSGDAGATGAGTGDANTKGGDAAKGGDDQLGDAGKEALRREREARATEKKRADDLQKEIDDIKAASQTDQEKAIKVARKEAADETATAYEAKIRRSEVRSALRAAGITNEKALDLAANAAVFAELKVDDVGSVEGLDKALEAFRKDTPELFAKPAPANGGDVTRGAQGAGDSTRPKSLEDALRAKMAPAAN